MGKRTMVLRLSGSAERVFSLMRYFSLNWGEFTLGEIIKLSGGKSIPTLIIKDTKYKK